MHIHLKVFQLIILSMVLSAMVHASPNDLEDILHSELSNTEVSDISVSKISSLQEMIDSLEACKERDIIFHEEDYGDYTSYAFGCHMDNTDLTTAEILVNKNNQGEKIISYQELSFNHYPMNAYQFNSLFLSLQFASVTSSQSVTPGIRALFSLAKVGVPVGLSFKAAKIVSPVRLDWQKHYIAGAIISGVTILSSDVLIMSSNNPRIRQMSDFQKDMLCSVAGLIGSIMAGVTKEVRDKVTGLGHPEVNDALYTAAGGASVALTFTIPIASLLKPKSRPQVLF